MFHVKRLEEKRGRSVSRETFGKKEGEVFHVKRLEKKKK